MAGNELILTAPTGEIQVRAAQQGKLAIAGRKQWT
jgi:hypothetical protein